MAYSFTERKRIRKDFGKLAEKMELPYLLAIQTDSYSKFLQVGTVLRTVQSQVCTQPLNPFSRLSVTPAVQSWSMWTISWVSRFSM